MRRTPDGFGFGGEEISLLEAEFTRKLLRAVANDQDVRQSSMTIRARSMAF